MASAFMAAAKAAKAAANKNDLGSSTQQTITIQSNNF